MARGQKLLDILKALTNYTTGGEEQPSGFDVVKAGEPLSEPRGFWGVLNRVNQQAARGRVAGEGLRTSRAKEAREEREAESLVKSREILGEQRTAQTERTRNLINVDNAKVELDKMRVNLQGAKTEGELRMMEVTGQARLMQADASLQQAQASLQRAATDEDRAYWDYQVKTRTNELKESRDKWQEEVERAKVRIMGQNAATAQNRATSYSRFVDAYANNAAGGDVLTTTETESEIPGFNVTPGVGGQTQFVPSNAATPFFKLIEKNKDVWGGKKGLFGFGATPPPTITPTTQPVIKKTKAVKSKGKGVQAQAGVKQGKVLVREKATGRRGYITPPFDTVKYEEIK